MSVSVVLIHGWGFGPAVWEPLLARLPGVDVYRPVLPGYAGDGVRPGTPAAVPAEEAILERLESAAGEWLLLGWSLGALVALRIARRRPQRVRLLGLVAGLPCFVRQPGWAAGWEPAALAAVRRRLKADPAGARDYVAALAARGDARARQVRRGLEAIPPPPARVLQRGLDDLEGSDERATLAALEVPIRIWLGDRDRLLGPDCAAAMRALLPRAQVQALAGAGHAPLLSVTDRLARELEVWL